MSLFKIVLYVVGIANVVFTYRSYVKFKAFQRSSYGERPTKHRTES